MNPFSKKPKLFKFLFFTKKIKDISVPSTYTISLILEDQTTEERELQLLSRGDLEPILDNCDCKIQIIINNK